MKQIKAKSSMFFYFNTLNVFWCLCQLFFLQTSARPHAFYDNQNTLTCERMRNVTETTLGSSLLLMAMKYQDKKLLTLTLEEAEYENVKINARHAFQYAMRNQLDYYFIDHLLGYDPQLSHSFIDGYPAVHFAALHPDANIIFLMGRYGANLNALYPVEEQGSMVLHRPLSMAIRENKLKNARALIHLGVKTNEILRSRKSVLALAATLDSPSFFEYLLNLSGAQRFSVAEKLNALQTIIEFKKIKLLEVFLVNREQYVTTSLPHRLGKETMKALHAAAFYDAHELIPLLVATGASPNAGTYEKQYTPLQIAIRKNNPQSVAALLAAGANPNLFKGPTDLPLIEACRMNSSVMVQALLSAQADIHGKSGSTKVQTVCLSTKNEAILQAFQNLEEMCGYTEIFFKPGNSSILLIFALFSIFKHVVVPRFCAMLREREENKIQNERIRQFELQQKNSQIADALNKLIRSYFSNQYLLFVRTPGQLCWQLPKERLSFKRFAQQEFEYAFELTVSARSIIDKVLIEFSKLPGFVVQGNDLFVTVFYEQNTVLSVDVLQGAAEKIKEAVYKEMVQSTEYQNFELKRKQKLLFKEYQDLVFSFSDMKAKHLAADLTRKEYVNQLDALKISMTGLLSLESKRFQTALTVAENSVKIKFDGELFSLCLQEIEEVLKTLGSRDLSLQEQAGIKNRSKYFQTLLTSHAIVLLDVRNKFDSNIATLKSAMEFLSKEKKQPAKNPQTHAQLLEERKRQKELEAQEALERAREQEQLNLQKKQEHRRQLEEARRKQRREQEEERLRQQRITEYKLKQDAERQRLEEQRTRFSVAASSSTAEPKRLQQKIILIGDVLQRYQYAEKKSDAFEIEIKFALLSHMLRLFQLADQYEKLKVTQSYRNAFMHQYRFMTLPDLIEFADSIAHLPKEKSTDKIKLEDILNQLAEERTNELLMKLRMTLTLLVTTEFYRANIKRETVKLDAKAYCETIDYLIQDLEKIHHKSELNLQYEPDKVSATIGILTCIGECYQQLFYLGVLVSKEINLLKHFLDYTLTIREKIGHVHIESEDEFTLLGNWVHQLNKITQMSSTSLVVHTNIPMQRDPELHTTTYRI